MYSHHLLVSIAILFIIAGIIGTYIHDRFKVIIYLKPYIGDARAKKIESSPLALWLHEKLTDMTHTQKGVPHYEIAKHFLEKSPSREEALDTTIQLIHYLRPNRFSTLDFVPWTRSEIHQYIHTHFRFLTRSDILRISLWALVLNPLSDKVIEDL